MKDEFVKRLLDFAENNSVEVVGGDGWLALHVGEFAASGRDERELWLAFRKEIYEKTAYVDGNICRRLENLLGKPLPISEEDLTFFKDCGPRFRHGERWQDRIESIAGKDYLSDFFWTREGSGDFSFDKSTNFNMGAVYKDLPNRWKAEVKRVFAARMESLMDDVNHDVQLAHDLKNVLTWDEKAQDYEPFYYELMGERSKVFTGAEEKTFREELERLGLPVDLDKDDTESARELKDPKRDLSSDMDR